jgi:cellulose synthase/poly-beta-1,6-N-acetylglucosamine synthase-like glycosyltransferase
MGLLLICYIIFLFVIWLFLSSAGLRSLLVKKPEERKKPNPKLKILLMVPCKGTDIELERNLKNATKQDYPNYKAIAIVESKADPALTAIKKSGIDYMIADFKCEGSGKVRNLASAIRKFKDCDAYCILDSDVNAQKGWLSALASGMDEKTGIVTAFPTFNPVDGGFWSKAKHIWGFVGFGLMENPETRFGWGGSLLFRKELMKDGGFELFSSSVSDDVTLTKLCKARGLTLAYAPEAKPIVDCKENARSFIEWSNRQTAFSVLGDKRNLYVGLVYYAAGALLLASAIILSIWSSYLFLILLIPFLLFVAVSYRRSGQSDLSIIPICFLLEFVYLYNIVNSTFMDQVEWRGKTYRLR